MRILHAPVQIAGQAGLSALGLRELGYTAETFYPPPSACYSQTADRYFRASNRWLRRVEHLWYMASFQMRYDVFHFHSGNTLAPQAWRYCDARMARRLGRKVIVEFWGSDVRLPSLAARFSPYYTDEMNLNEERARAKMRRWSDITGGHVICGDPTLLPALREYFSHVHVVESRVDTRSLQPKYPSPEQRTPVVVHAPSRLVTKGTSFVRAAVECLKARALQFEYVEVHGVPHPEALEIYAQADLVVDQMRLGHYGVLAAEAMALGKPVICYIAPEVLAEYPHGFPIIGATPDTLTTVLEHWLQRPEARHSLGRQSREYAERVHDCRVGAAKLASIYESLPA